MLTEAFTGAVGAIILTWGICFVATGCVFWVIDFIFEKRY